MKILTQTRNGVTTHSITDSKYHYTFGYYSNNSWISNHQIAAIRRLGRVQSEFPDDNELVLIDLETETETVIASNLVGFCSVLVHGTNLYYFHQDDATRRSIIRYDLNSGAKTILHTGERIGFPHITDDGRYMNWQVSPVEPNGPNACERLDIQTGEVVRMFEKVFAVPFTVSDHMMINPKNPDQIFFAHEGTTYYVSNRLWLYDKERGMFPLARQRLNEDGDLGDCFGHECWAPDGKGLYFVKYPCSPTPPTGLCYVDTNQNQTDVLYGKYPYWHVSCSPDGRYLGADTQSDGFSGVCLVDLQTGKEIMPIQAQFLWEHPCHPHPHFSPDSSRVMFHELLDGQVSISILEVVEAFRVCD